MADDKPAVAHGNAIHALPRRNGKCPVPRRKPGDRIFMPGSKILRKRTVFNPKQAVFGSAPGKCEIRIQHIHIRVRLPPEIVLVCFAGVAVLQRRERLDHLPGCSKVVKLGVGKRDNSHAQRADFRVRFRGSGAERRPEVRVELVSGCLSPRKRAALPSATAHQDANRPPAQQPESGIHKISMVTGQFADSFGRRLLEEKCDFARRLAG